MPPPGPPIPILPPPPLPGGGVPPGAPNAIAYYNGFGTTITSDGSFLGGILDAFQRPCIRDFRLGPTNRGTVHKLGAWTVDGDPQNVISEGFVTYGSNAAGIGPNNNTGGFGFYEPNGFGVLQVIPGVNGGNAFYSCGFEDGGPNAPFGIDGFIVNDNLDIAIFQIKRTNRTTVISGNTDINGDHIIAPVVDGQTVIGTDALRFKRIRAQEIVTGDLELKDESRNAHWVLREEETRIVAINKTTGKRYAIALTPIDDKEEEE